MGKLSPLNVDSQVGVHIADVSYYVKTDTDIDREASQRGVTVYLTDRRIDMYEIYRKYLFFL